MIVIRFNPDTTRVARVPLKFTLADKLDLLTRTIKTQLMTYTGTFAVKLIQLYFDDPFASRDNYQPCKMEDITSVVCL